MTNNNNESFQFPLYYHKEPFFTLQPITNTRKIQLQMWQEIVLSYSRNFKIYELDINESLKTNLNLFYNEKINRRLSRDSLKTILEDIVDNGYGEWLDKDKNRMLVMWRKPEEWASIIYKWVSACGFLDTVLTIWEIQNGDDSKDQDFHQLNTTILLKSLKVLEKQSKAQIFSSDDENNLGVKFFSI